MSQPAAGTPSTVTVTTSDGITVTVESNGTVTVTPPDTPPPPPAGTPATIFFDDFTGPKNSAPGSGTWLVNGVAGPNNWGIATGRDVTSSTNQYVDLASNVYMDGDSHLVIATTAGTGGYGTNSGRIATWDDGGYNSGGSKFTATWGTFSASIKCTPTAGYWPAFWAYGAIAAWPAGGEIDCLENFGTGYSAPLGQVSAGIHGGTGAGNNERSLAGGYYTIADGNFHTYSWTIPEDYSSITFQDDGVNMAVSGYNPITKADWVSYATEGGGGGPVVGATGADWPFGPDFPYGIVLNVSTKAGGVNPASPGSIVNALVVDWVKVTQP